MYPLHVCCLTMHKSKWGTGVMGHMGNGPHVQWDILVNTADRDEIP